MRLPTFFRRDPSPSLPRPVFAAAAVDAERPGCGWFESSHELCCGLEISDDAMDLTTFALWAARSPAAASKH